MNANQKLEDGDGLDRVLQQWTVDSPLPLRFQEGVWRRIEALEARREQATSTRLRRFLEIVIPRPRFAYGYLSALLVAGIAAGSVAAQIRTTRLNSELSMRYVQSIDPYRAEVAHP